MTPFDNILVVCIGNICRSPMAAGLLLAQYPNKHIDSAGLSAVVNHSADANAIAVMRDEAIDISDHIAKQINESLAIQADIILTMSDNQTKWIETTWPFCRGKTFKIGHWLEIDIADPYRLDKSAFLVAKQDIIAGLNSWADKIS